MDLLKFVAPATAARRSAYREAAEFAATVRPGRTYYSVLECHWPWGNGRLLKEWTASSRKGWPNREYMFGHMSASAVWLGYGPIHETRPGGLQTFDEYARRGDFPPDVAKALRSAKLTPAGV